MLVSHENCATEFTPYEWAIRYRQPVSIIVALICFALLVTTGHPWPETSSLNPLMDSLGFIFIVVAAFGRIWSSLYISGYKEDQIVTEGPYAMVRNPLYVFSFIGALGMGLTTRNLFVLAILACAFLLYYPLVVLAEERNLQRIFGQVYLEYTSRVPRFLPRTFCLVEPDTYPVRPRHVRRSLQEIIWFFWFYLIVHLVEGIHQSGWLATWLRIS